MAKDTQQLTEVFNKLHKSISSVFVGKKEIVHTVLIGFLSGLHILIEDIPGVGKTTLAKTLAKSSGMDFGRIQFTPDLLPGDVLGMTIWSVEKRDFVFKKGAIMHQFILADEINRASARTQSSLLEAMQEGAVTVDGTTYPLPQPFFVVATQNPVTFSGTFLLPEAEVDRFGISFSIGHPLKKDEIEILDRFKEQDPLDKLTAVITPQDIAKARREVTRVHVDEKIKNYLVDIAHRTRSHANIYLGMSPRATQHLLRAAQAQAVFNSRDFILPEDVLAVIKPVLRHRLILKPEAKLERVDVDTLIDAVCAAVPLPSGL